MPALLLFPVRADRAPLDFVLTDFPFPLALPYGRLQDELDRQEPLAAAWQLRDALECLLKFTASLAVADCLHAGPDTELADRLLERLFKPMSLGDWHTLLELALKPLERPAREGRLADSGRVLPELYGVFFVPRTGKRSPLGVLLAGTGETQEKRGLVKWRNEVFGHGAFRKARGFYAVETRRWLPRLALATPQA